MFISEHFKNKDLTVSFEVFPPKADAPFEPVINAVTQLSELKPDYISVTYGAGGGTSKNTIKIASNIQDNLGVTALAHLSCVSSTRDEVAQIINELKEAGVENVLALRGDIPNGMSFPEAGYYKYAYQLVDELKKSGNFCVGAACYPEGHPECMSRALDLEHLKAKVDYGCDFLLTQMFFDNNVLYSFLYSCLKAGIDLPIEAGIMPVTNSRQIKHMIELTNASLPAKFRAIMDKFGDDPVAMRQAGIAYAIDQIVDLAANGVKGIHLYTMNKPDIARTIMNDLSGVLGR